MALLILCCLAILQPCSVRADRIENRFLLLVDVSSNVKNSAQQARAAVAQLLQSGISGLITNGDTLGVWTYDDTLHTEYPMQIWREADQIEISQSITNYLQKLKYKKPARFEVVLPPLSSVIKDSPYLTVIWVSDGSGGMHGTPFDQQINQIQADLVRDLRPAKVPLITALAVRNGEVVEFTVNMPVAPFRIPVARPKPAPAQAKAVAVTNTPAPAPATPPKPAKEVRQIVISAPPKTNPVAVTPPKTEAAAPTVVAETPAATPSTNVVAVAPSSAAPASEVKPVEAVQPAPQAPIQSSPAVQRASAPTAAATAPATVATPPTPAPVPATAQMITQAAPPVTVTAAQAVPPRPETPVEATAAQVEPAKPAVVEPTAPAPASGNGTVQLRLATLILIGACATLVIAAVIAWILWKALRREQRSTLITESFARIERSKK